MFRMKAEREWDDEEQTSFTNSYFALDLKDLEEAISCVPIHQQLNIPDGEVDVSPNKSSCPISRFG